ncbi:hypothetical protein AX16_002629 [Volvariella volvacea WC 439]|nr:hypothetical protein AX16_002629 [Volvariella volvacea WC 439]
MSEAQFLKAAEIIANLPKDGPVKPTTDDQLYFYKYYKQAKVGDNTTARPGALTLDFTARPKWDAWESVKGTSKEEAYKKYVEKFIELLKAAGDEQSLQYIAQIESA